MPAWYAQWGHGAWRQAPSMPRVGASIFVVPGTLAACLGSYAPLALFVCAVAIGSVAICFAEGGSRVPTSGGAYGYVEAAFGPLAGYVAGTVLWFSNVLSSGGIAAALADTAVSVLPTRWMAVAHTVVIVAVVGSHRPCKHWRSRARRAVD